MPHVVKLIQFDYDPDAKARTEEVCASILVGPDRTSFDALDGYLKIYSAPTPVVLYLGGDGCVSVLQDERDVRPSYPVEATKAVHEEAKTSGEGPSVIPPGSIFADHLVQEG